MLLAAHPRSHDVTNFAIIICCCLHFRPLYLLSSVSGPFPLLISKNWNIASIGIFYTLSRRIYFLCTYGMFLNCDRIFVKEQNSKKSETILFYVICFISETLRHSRYIWANVSIYNIFNELIYNIIL